jgi:hypothetical protein
MTDTPISTVIGFIFYVIMLAFVVFCCSGCTQERTSTYVDKGQLKSYTAKQLREHTESVNATMERQARGVR